MGIIVAIIVIWAVVIPCMILAAATIADRRATAWRRSIGDWSPPMHVKRRPPRCVVRLSRPGRATTRRACPERAHRVWRRPAST